MNEKDIRKTLCGADDEIVGRLAGGALTDQEKERIYTMSRRKLDKMNSSFVNTGDQVSGVERDTRPAWRRYAGLAAALVIAGGAVVGGGAYMLKGLSGGSAQFAEITESAPVEETEAETVAPETEEATPAEIINEDSAEYTETTDLVDYQFQVNRLTNMFIDYAATIYGRGLEVDKSAPVEKTVTDINGNETTITFYHVIDERYRTWDDVVRASHAIFADDLADDILDNWGCMEESEIDENNNVDFFFRNSDGWYIQACLIDEKLPNWDPEWLEEEPVLTVNEDGTLSTTLSHYLLDSDDKISTDFVIGQVDNGMSDNWRILSYEETYIEAEE